MTRITIVDKKGHLAKACPDIHNFAAHPTQTIETPGARTTHFSKTQNSQQTKPVKIVAMFAAAQSDSSSWCLDSEAPDI